VPGSIAVLEMVKLGGVAQSLLIRGQSAANPVLLFLHGGPGMPEYFLTQQYPTGLERDFTVVWWDRRGAAMHTLGVGTTRGMRSVVF
jgi:pimeloyl-ACP methyl ester carboxylesterase